MAAAQASSRLWLRMSRGRGFCAAPKLTHVGEDGRAKMVDVSDKPQDAKRTAVASGEVWLGQIAYDLVAHNALKKGDALAVAQLAGVMAAKQTSSLIPLCHNIFLSKVDVALTLEPARHTVRIVATATAVGPTGVEMEALTAVSVAALALYDMAKAASKEIRIEKIQLDVKTGGKGGSYRRAD